MGAVPRKPEKIVLQPEKTLTIIDPQVVSRMFATG
jgi:hypothetical protein